MHALSTDRVCIVPIASKTNMILGSTTEWIFKKRGYEGDDICFAQ